MHLFRIVFLITVLVISGIGVSFAQPAEPAPERAEGEGPFERLVIRGAIMIDGTGAPPFGPVDIVIEGNRIANIVAVGAPGVPISPDNRPAEGDYEIDAHGMYILPGFIDSHAHISQNGMGAFGRIAPAEYSYKLWMANGVTTIREVGSGNGRAWTLNEKRRSANNEITAPRIMAYDWFYPSENPTPDAARAWVRQLAEEGGDGIKFGGAPPELMRAALDEANALGLKTAMHHAQMSVARWNVLDSARAGLTSMEHWYGLPEALFTDRTVQDYPVDYNYQNEAHRFGEAGRLWKQAAEPWSEKWNAVMNELLALDFTLSPTFTIYEATRDVEAARNREVLEDYTWPSLHRFFQPSRESHGSFWLDWTTADEIEWRNNFRLWMTFVNEYKNRGGRVVVGDDPGFIYRLMGFGYIREFELLQEAGFHPLEVIRAATLNGAEVIGRADELGSIQIGKLADLVIVDSNPLANFKVLYATGAERLNENNQIEQYGGIDIVIKDGIVYDAPALLEDVRRMTEAQWQEESDD